ncbi:MAG: hypothetical protein RB191_05660 [Terriglobia bacterium]|nr:hypothetical protein [Terriglobia bacterium]
MRERSADAGGVHWFLLALLLSPLLAVLVLLACPVIDAAQQEATQDGILGLNPREEQQEVSYWEQHGAGKTMRAPEAFPWK